MAMHNTFGPLLEYLGEDPECERFLQFKMETTDKQFCEATECQIFYEALNECYSIGYDEDPDYSKLKFILVKALLGENQAPGGRYSAERPIIQNNLNNQEIPIEMEIPEEEILVQLIESKVNPENTKANLG